MNPVYSQLMEAYATASGVLEWPMGLDLIPPVNHPKLRRHFVNSNSLVQGFI
jgi:hypothetical protein